MASQPARPIAFVAGATGYAGREVVRALAERGVDTVAHVRPDSPRLAEWRQRITDLGARADATPWSTPAMSARLAALRPTHVFALLGTTRARAAAAARTGHASADYEAVDYGLSVLLLRAAAALAPAPRFVYLSSIGASLTTGNAYLRVRGRVETEVMGSGLPYLIVRPSFITGPDRDESRPAERVSAAVLDAGTRLLAGLGARRLRARYRPRSGAELAAAIVRLSLEPGPSRIVEAEQL